MPYYDEDQVRKAVRFCMTEHGYAEAEKVVAALRAMTPAAVWRPVSLESPAVGEFGVFVRGHGEPAWGMRTDWGFCTTAGDTVLAINRNDMPRLWAPLPEPPSPIHELEAQLLRKLKALAESRDAAADTGESRAAATGESRVFDLDTEARLQRKLKALAESQAVDESES